MAACVKTIVLAQGPPHKENGVVLHKDMHTAVARSGYVHKLWWSLVRCLVRALVRLVRALVRGHHTAQAWTLCAGPGSAQSVVLVRVHCAPAGWH